MIRFFLLVLFLLCLSPANSFAQNEAQYSAARLINGGSFSNSPEKLMLGVDIGLTSGWKTYWRMPGDAGLAPDFNWTGSSNLKSTNILWPAPQRFVLLDLDNIGYHDRVVFPVEIERIDPSQTTDIQLKLNLLVCSDICVPETHTIGLVVAANSETDPADRATVETALKSIPTAADDSFKFTSAQLQTDDENRIFLRTSVQTTLPIGTDGDLFVEHESGIVFGKPAFEKNADGFDMLSPVHSSEQLPQLQQKLSTGILTLTFAAPSLNTAGIESKIALGAIEVDVLQEPLVQISFLQHLASIPLSILLAAFIGGLILNLMPCVLPVLSLKILSVVSHGGHDSRAIIFRNFMASALGIVASFWLMATVLIIMKNTGQAIGWGIQFQNPAFLIFLTVIILLFAVNLWGWFEIPMPRFIADKIGSRSETPTFTGHFLTGAFATLLATPCTAPFLGTAVGFALAASSLEIILVFTFLGLGLAAPYILLAFSPGLFQFLPKPGAWMITLKKILSLALFATAAWLISVLLTLTMMPATDNGWTKFDESLIAPAVESGQTVFVDVTADWCLTCKANKKFILESDTVSQALHAENILLLQGDWTHPDEKISAFLNKHQRYGIPFNIVYGPGVPEGIPLPELLTEKAVMDALANASGE